MVEESEADERDALPRLERIADLVASLASTMRQSALSELDVDLADVTIRLRRSASAVGDACDASPERAAEIDPPRETPPHLITAPMIGTYYTSPSPGAPPFVAEGDEVFTGQTIGIIEAMKIMNEIAADRSGIVAEVLVSNGQPVEYGSPLIRLARGRTERR